MRDDPANWLRKNLVSLPPSQGPGSGKAAWQAFALDIVDDNATLWGFVNEQSATIRELQAEVALLRAQIETRKPRGGRERTPDATVARIERALAEGQSTRDAARIFGVSHMTVARIAKRRRERDRACALLDGGRHER